jgi:hypothetical protein
VKSGTTNCGTLSASDFCYLPGMESGQSVETTFLKQEKLR